MVRSPLIIISILHTLQEGLIKYLFHAACCLYVVYVSDSLDEGFYPNALHSVAGLSVTTITGLNEVLTESCVVCLCGKVIYPVGICALLQTIERKTRCQRSNLICSFAQLVSSNGHQLRSISKRNGFCAVPSAVVLSS